MGGIFSALGLKAKIAVLIFIAAIVGGLIFWVNWSAGKIAEVTQLNETITQHKKTIEDLRKEIKDYTTRKEELDAGFKEIEDSQIDLLCAARGNSTITIPVKVPTIVEVVKYVDRNTGCPTTDKEQAEPYDPNVSVLRPTNEAISLQTLNNSWKAYCLATNNEDKSCEPFR